MVRHFVIMSSSYSLGKRIAIDHILEEELDVSLINKEMETIKEMCGQTVSISTHWVVTDSTKWESVWKKDAFFADVYQVKKLSEFIELILEDRKLKGIDIAKYILTKKKCSHLKLEKLVYFCYAEYMHIFKEKLFSDKIYAFKYGPVVESVYEKYKGQKEEIDGSDIKDDYDVMSLRSRVLFAHDGVKKLEVIERTLDMYGDKTASELVSLTHKIRTPWSSVEKGMYTEIPDKAILELHVNEMSIG